jgi:hypothetical protein
MLILKRLVFRWDGKHYREAGFVQSAYAGRMAYAKGDSTQELVPTGPWSTQIPQIDTLFNAAQQLLATGNSPNVAAPTPYPGQQVAGTNPILQQSQQNISTQANQSVNQNNNLMTTAQNATTKDNPVSTAASPMVGNMQNALIQLMSGMNPAQQFGQQNAGLAQDAIARTTSPYSGLNMQGAPQNAVGNMNITGELQKSLQGGTMNPYLDQILQGATRGLNRQFTQQTVPGIRDASIAAGGQRGSAAEGIAEGMATQNLQDNIGDITAKLFGQAFDSGNQERQNALGMINTAAAQNPQLKLQSAALNQQGQQAQQGLGLQGADLILQQLMGGTQLGQQGALGAAGQTGDLLSTGNAQGVTQMLQAMGMIPQLQNANMGQMGMQNQVGLQLMGQDQAGIDAEIAKYMFNQFAPFASLAQFQNFVSGGYGSSVGNGPTSTYAPQPGTYPGNDPNYPGVVPPYTPGSQPFHPIGG